MCGLLSRERFSQGRRVQFTRKTTKDFFVLHLELFLLRITTNVLEIYSKEWLDYVLKAIWKITSEGKRFEGELVLGSKYVGYAPWDEHLILAPSAWTFWSTFQTVLKTRAVFLLAHRLSAGAEGFFLWDLFGTFLGFWWQIQDRLINHHRA